MFGYNESAMKIKYLGHSSFKITGKTEFGEEVTLVTDPFNDKEVGIKYPKQKADVVSISHHHGDHDAVDNIEGNPKEDYVIIDTPGEYEIKGLRVYGIGSFHDDKKGAERGTNTIYIYDFDEARIAHLGDLGHKLEPDQLEELENIDILITPVGGVFTIDAKQANEIIEDLEPSTTIPMHYKTDKHADMFKDLGTLEDFLKETDSKSEPQKEINLKSHNDLGQLANITTLSF